MFLDPGKLLVIAVVGLVVLGPDRLPKVAKTAGSLWHDFTRWRAALDQQVRGAFPDLPPTHEIVAAVRSPIALLDRLAKESVAPAPAVPAPSAGSGVGVDVAVAAGPDASSDDPWEAWPASADPSDAAVADRGLVATDVSMN